MGIRLFVQVAARVVALPFIIIWVVLYCLFALLRAGFQALDKR